ncbi:MAG: hypothetical protein AAFS11_06240, partial [Planctomycetota bacterium]
NLDSGEYDVGDFARDFEIQSNPDVARGTVNIDGEVIDSNRDFLFQVVVFQLFNPFDVPVSLRHFYIEFGESIYRPRPLAGDEASYMLQPGETRLLFATNPGLTLPPVANPINISSVAAQGAVYQSIGDRIQDAVAQAVTLNADFTTPPSLAGVLPASLAFGIIENLIPDDERIPLRRYDTLGSVEQTAFQDLLVGDRAAHGDDDLRNRVAYLWWDLGERFDPNNLTATGEWRRDDLLADRIVDTTPTGDPPALDQRLDLDPASFAAGAFGLPAGTVNDAITGEVLDLDAPTNAAFTEQFEAFRAIAGVNGMNEDRQRSIGLWGRIRRFDTTSDPTGAGGRRANDLPNPNDVVPIDPVQPPAGINAAQGDAAVLGVPTGALPAAALETSENRVLTTEALASDFPAVAPTYPMRPDELWFDDSFPTTAPPPGGTIAFVNYESAETIDAFISDQLLDATRFRDFRQQSLLFDLDPAGNVIVDNGVMSATRYSYLPGPPPTTLYLEYESIFPFDPDGVGPTGPLEAGGVSTRTEPYSGSDLIQIAHNSREFRTEIDGFPQLRVGDLLNVLAVGPYRMPLRNPPGTADGYPAPGTAARAIAYRDQWTTLSEVLGLSENVLTTLEPGPWSDEFDRLAGVLDRGQLRLDDFVPYFDFEDDNGDGDFTNDGFIAAVDRVRGLGIPAALNIFDVAQAGGELPDRAYGDIDQPIAGLVNINTAPPSVLRLLPGLYQDVAITGAPAPTRPAWEQRLRSEAVTANVSIRYANALNSGTAATGVNSGQLGTPFDRLDIASSILSYREVGSGYHRLFRDVDPNFGFGGTRTDRPLNMGPVAVLADPTDPTTTDLTRGVEMLRDFDTIDDNGDGLFDFVGPNIEALRTAPGFGSIGELLAVRSSGDIGTDENARRFQYGLDSAARDRRTVSQLFVDPETGDPAEPEPDFTVPALVRDFIAAADQTDPDDNLRIVTLDPALLGDPLLFDDVVDDEFRLPVADQIPDDYDEQLIHMNLLANSVSTSSDFYAAWMVIHGFEEEDTEDLGPNEPMRPSFRGRYLMIVDRSNVVSRGDTPRVLAFLEVPYDEEVRSPAYTVAD